MYIPNTAAKMMIPMLKKYQSIIAIATLFLLMSCQLSATSCFAPPTTPSSNLQFSSLEGNRMLVSWTKGDGARRIVIAQAATDVISAPTDGIDYNANGQYGNGDPLAPGEFVVYDGTGSSFFFLNLNHSTTYYFHIYEYNGSSSTTEYLLLPATGNQATLSPPAIQASGLNFTEVTGSSFTLNWVNGDGTGRIVLLRESSAVTAVPQDYATYTGNSSFGASQQIGTGNYVVYRGSGSTVTITNLEPEKTYYAAVFDYNGNSGPVYLSPAATANQLTGGAPTVEASNLVFSSIDGNRFSSSFTKGNGTRRLVIIKKDSPVTAVPADGIDYTASSQFGNGTEIAPGEFVVYASTFSSVLVSNLVHSSSYYIKIFEYNGTGSNTKYLTLAPLNGSQATLFPPTLQTSAFSFTNVTGNSMTINWTNGNGTSRLIVMKAASAVDAVPENYTSYNSSSNFGSVFAHLGNDNYIVYRFSGTSVTVTGLNPNVVYHVAGFERNGSLGYVYLTPAGTASQQTVGDPTLPPSNLSYSSIEGNSMRLLWTNGNGSRRLVIAKKGSAVSSLPVDGTSYIADDDFGQGMELAAGEFVVYDGSSTNFIVRNLEHSSTYHFRVFEYNGSGVNSFYLTDSFASGSQATPSPPSTAASDIVFSDLSPISVRLSVSPGNGNGRIIIVKKDVAVDVAPVDYQAHTSNPSFGALGSEIGATGNYVVYRFTGTSVNVTNLEAGFVYHFAIFEYNGSFVPVYGTASTVGSVLIPFLPTIQATNMSFLNVGATEMRSIWTNGNGARRIVLAKKNAPVDTEPVDGIDYTASSVFGAGDELGTGNFIVYNNASNSVTLTGLEVNSTYHFAVFECAGTGSNATYLKPGLVSSQKTVAKPDISSSSVTISNLTASSATISWTNGNGSNRLLIASESAVPNTMPVDGTNYDASSFFGNAQTAIGNGFAIYKGSGTSTTISNLQEGTTYHIAVYEYNGTIISPAYIDIAGTGSLTTSGAPLIQTNNLASGGLSSSSVQLSWTNGSGQKRIIIAKEATAVDVIPIDGLDYLANAGFGSGTELGTGNFVVYTGSDNTALISGLTAEQTYHFAIFEYNFSGTATRYLQANPATLQVTAAPLPVELSYFTGKAVQDGILLEWQTATELNNDYFELQYSDNGRDFSVLDKIKGRGTSFEPQNYAYLQENVQNGIYYYRLQQFDFDAESEFSNIIIVRKDNGKVGLTLYPNPVYKQLTIKLNKAFSSPKTAYISNYAGRVVQKITIPNGHSRYVFETKNLPVGIYQLRLEGESLSVSFVKQ